MKSKLIQLGFTNNEAIIFETLVKYGEISGSKLSRRTGIDRSVTYNLLDNLISKGYVTYVVKEGRRLFSIKDPECLLVPIEERIDLAKDLIKEIKTKQKTELEKTRVTVHEGREAIKLLNSELLNIKECYLLNATGKLYESLPYYMAQLHKKAKKGVRGKMILSSKEATKTIAAKDPRSKWKLMPEKYWNKAPITIFNDVVIISVLDYDNPIAIRIQDKTIAEAFKKDFEFMWDMMK